MRTILILLALGFAACGGPTAKNQVADTTPSDLTQVLYFHGKQRCVTCNAIEKLTKEVTDSLADEKIVMRVIDITQDEAMADKYEVSWSALILDRGGKVKNLTEMGFDYARTQPQIFKTRLTGAIAEIAQ